MRNLLKSRDYYRLTKAVDCETDFDLGMLAWCAVLLTEKIKDRWEERFGWNWPELTLKPDPIVHSIRMLRTEAVFEKWRVRYPDEFRAVQAVEDAQDFAAMINILSAESSLMRFLLK